MERMNEMKQVDEMENMEIWKEPVKYIGGRRSDRNYSHGKLPPVVGAHNYQIMRANRTDPGKADSFGWTYNHAPMLAYWRGRFYLEYLSNPIHEHVAPGQTLLMTSADGVTWSHPMVVFPPYPLPAGTYRVGDWNYLPDGQTVLGNVTAYDLSEGTTAIMHQRMGFYRSPNDKLLVLGFYGICPTTHSQPNDGSGIGRVVREVYEDGSFGPIYFIRYNRHAGWNENNTFYPFYGQAQDSDFVSACEALLADRLATLQWWEEDRSSDGFYAVEGHKALSYYHLPDGKVIGLWKWSKAAESHDEGQTWTPVVEAPSLVMEGGKIWGQHTSDGRYALSYTPLKAGRYPLALVSGEDGRVFDHLAHINGDVSRQRFVGNHKGVGMHYIRGIEENCDMPTDGNLWLVYSMSKEDIWISRVPVPICYTREEHMRTIFTEQPTGTAPLGWNVTSLQWATVKVADYPSAQNKSLEIMDADPYDYAKAAWVFPQTDRVQIQFSICAKQIRNGFLDVDVADEQGNVAVGLRFDQDGSIKCIEGVSECGRIEGVSECEETAQFSDLISYEEGYWYAICMCIDAQSGVFTLSVNGIEVGGEMALKETVRAVHCLTFRTGVEWNSKEKLLQTHEIDHEKRTVKSFGTDLPHADRQVPPVYYYINYVETKGL